MNDLQRAKKMLKAYGGDVYYTHSSFTPRQFRAVITCNDCEEHWSEEISINTSRQLTLDAARRAIELYRLVKHGPEVVKEMRRIRTLLESLPVDALGCSTDRQTGKAEYPYRDEAIHRIDKALSHFPEESSA